MPIEVRETDTMAEISAKQLAYALRLTPAASQTYSKAPGRVGPADTSYGFPLFAQSAKGPYVWDIHGRKFLDCFGANAAVPLGYGYQPVTEAVERALRDGGGIFSLPSYLEAEVSERFLAVCAPWAQSVRWTKTGSEATHAAYKIAKDVTRKSLVMLGDWAYHGWHEWCSDRDCGPLRVVSYPFGDESLDQLLHKDEVAAVFVEPHRWREMPSGWLRWVREWCTRYGALLVFDEMVYGLRWARGGSAEYYGVTPDLACFGKALGNGIPVACVCGRAEVMAHTVEAKVSGTYGGDVLGLAAANAVLKAHEAEPELIEQIWRRGADVWQGFNLHAPGEALLEGCHVHWRLKMPTEALLESALRHAAENGVLAHRASNNASAAMTSTQARQAGEILGRAAADALREG